MRSLINQLYVIFGLNIPLLGKNRRGSVKITGCGIYHETQDTRRPRCGWKKAIMCGKNHCQFVFLWSGKNQTCVAFIKHFKSNKRCVEKDTHVCKKQTCVSFPIQVVLLFVFALVFEFLIFDIVYYIYIYLFRGAHAISGVKNTSKTALKKITCLGIPTHVWKNPHT